MLKKELSMSSTIIPTMRYDDPSKMIDWLCSALGFEKHLVYENEQKEIVHAELKHGTGLIMIGPNIPTEFGKFIKQPKDIGGQETQVTFIFVQEIDAHFKKAKASGAEILMPLKKQDYGASDYVCKDPEGHIWSFGDYNPWIKK